MNPRTAAVLALAFGPFLVGSVAHAQDSSIFVQCPTETLIHNPFSSAEGSIKCGHLLAGDGMVTMADDSGRDMYMFGFAPVQQQGWNNAFFPAPPVDALAPPINSPEFPGWVMDSGTLAANSPSPTIAIDEDDELFLTLTNVGMAMRPDLADPHSVHWHGFPNASAVFDGVPDASISINVGASLAYYYNAKDPGTYLYHCHVEATEHMQMGMQGNLYVRPKQNRTAVGATLSNYRVSDNTLLGSHVHQAGHVYAYNDNDGSTRYDREYPLQMSAWDPVFHDASFEVQPLPFVSMEDTYYLINGRGYPDTARDDENMPMAPTIDPLDNPQHSQPMSSLVKASPNEKVLLRISNLSVTELFTLAINGLKMQVIARDARLLRDDDGNNLYYDTQSITLGGGQTADVIVDTTGTSIGDKFVLYSTNLNHLANDAENFGGLMTEIWIVAP